MSKVKETQPRELLADAAVQKPKFSFPPSLSGTSRSRMRHRELNDRRRKVEEALRLLPLRDKKTDVSPFISAFETTYYSVIRQKEDQPASTSLVEKQLSEVARKCDKLESYLKGMHPDALTAWANAGRVYGSTNIVKVSGALMLILNEAIELTEIALGPLKAARRAAKRGAPSDAMAAALRETAGWAYKKLTGKRGGRAYNAYEYKETDTEFIKFLDRIYEAYGIHASARSRARVRQRRMGNNSKK